MLQPLYPKASREVIVTFDNANTLNTGQQVEDKALEMVNSALVNSPIGKRLLYGARFSLASNLVLTTGLHETNEDLGDYPEVIGKALTFIGPASATLSVPWTKFLLHGVPTQLDLETIRKDVEGYCSGAKLGHTPRWLATEADRIDKPASTIVLAFVGSVAMKDLGGRAIRIGNRLCNLTRYLSFGPQTQCLNCLGFDHPKELCKQPCLCSMHRKSRDIETRMYPETVPGGIQMPPLNNEVCELQWPMPRTCQTLAGIQGSNKQDLLNPVRFPLSITK
jgi:hypothetical protein